MATNLRREHKAKAKALKHLDTLGQLGNDRQNSALQDMAETAWDALWGVLNQSIDLGTIVQPILAQVKTVLGF